MCLMANPAYEKLQCTNTSETSMSEEMCHSPSDARITMSKAAGSQRQPGNTFCVHKHYLKRNDIRCWDPHCVKGKTGDPCEHSLFAENVVHYRKFHIGQSILSWKNNQLDEKASLLYPLEFITEKHKLKEGRKEVGVSRGPVLQGLPLAIYKDPFVRLMKEGARDSQVTPRKTMAV
ncbi:hypothetical protein P7K49_035950 [Saguinus oedipus]|uniref:Uncharacterized protein n=1 Tax=Saguinus oedipus TaxID=9490 RepID=A0ABQ9TP25_SAGOE|nr:hypothetical protein P7K49_035950 [Saguinus oedipus]